MARYRIRSRRFHYRKIKHHVKRFIRNSRRGFVKKVNRGGVRL